MGNNREIERKFLLKRVPSDLSSYPQRRIEQGYLVATPDGRQVRLRRTPKCCTLTYKTADGAIREEREIEITAGQFDALWPATAGKRLTKVRHEIPWQGYTIEIDVYGGINKSILVAEVEFEDEKQCVEFQPPDWFGEEVTNDPRYSNVLLARDTNMSLLQSLGDLGRKKPEQTALHVFAVQFHQTDSAFRHLAVRRR